VLWVRIELRSLCVGKVCVDLRSFCAWALCLSLSVCVCVCVCVFVFMLYVCVC